MAFTFLFLWCGAGLNRRHKDFQSFALPTELPHLSTTEALAKVVLVLRRFSKGGLKFESFFQTTFAKATVVEGSKNKGISIFSQRIQAL
jgi:hypothetical protein